MGRNRQFIRWFNVPNSVQSTLCEISTKRKLYLEIQIKSISNRVETNFMPFYSIGNAPYKWDFIPIIFQLWMIIRLHFYLIFYSNPPILVVNFSLHLPLSVFRRKIERKIFNSTNYTSHVAADMTNQWVPVFVKI